MDSSVALVSTLASAYASQSTRLAVGIATINKTNEAAKEAGAAMVQMIEASLPPMSPRQLDIYA